MTETEGWPNTNKLPRYKPPKGVGTVLGVPVSHLVIPDHLWVRIRHLHAGNSTKNERRRASFMTVVEVINIATGKVQGIWKASPRNGDAPNRARGLQVALGGAIIRAMAGHGEGIPWMKRKSGHWPEAARAARELQTLFSAPVRFVFGNPDHVYQGTEDVPVPAPAPAPARAPAREARKTTFSDEDVTVKMAEGIENEVQSALDPGQDSAPGDAAEAERHPPQPEAVRVPYSKLTSEQVLQAGNLLNRVMQRNTSVKEWTERDYMVRAGRVVGTLPAAHLPEARIPESQL